MATPPHLLHLFSTFAAGGPQVRTATLVRALGDDYRHTIVALDGDRACAARLDGLANVAFADPPAKGWLGARVLRFASLMQRTRPDLVLTYNWGAIEAVVGARTAGIRRIVHAEDGFGPDEADGQFRRRIWFRRAVLPLASRVVVPSLFLLDHAEQTWRVAARARVHVPNGIDLDHFAPLADDDAAGQARCAALRAKWGVQPGERVLGSVARLRAEKGLDLSIRAFAAMAGASTCRLVLVGDGPEEPRLRELAAARDVADRVVFAGPIEEPRDCYRAFDLFLLPSLTEQMPISLLEAMGCGLPAVATNVGDVAAMLAVENRRFVAGEREPMWFADLLAQLLADAGVRARVGAANRKKALAEYAVATMVGRYRALYEEVLRGGG